MADILHSRGRIQLATPLRDWVQKALEAAGIAWLRSTPLRRQKSILLPGPLHGDPAYRFLIATARIHDLVLATRDKGAIEYRKAGHMRVLPL